MNIYVTIKVLRIIEFFCVGIFSEKVDAYVNESGLFLTSYMMYLWLKIVFGVLYIIFKILYYPSIVELRPSLVTKASYLSMFTENADLNFFLRNKG